MCVSVSLVSSVVIVLFARTSVNEIPCFINLFLISGFFFSC